MNVLFRRVAAAIRVWLLGPKGQADPFRDPSAGDIVASAVDVEGALKRRPKKVTFAAVVREIRRGLPETPARRGIAKAIRSVAQETLDATPTLDLNTGVTLTARDALGVYPEAAQEVVRALRDLWFWELATEAERASPPADPEPLDAAWRELQRRGGHYHENRLRIERCESRRESIVRFYQRNRHIVRRAPAGDRDLLAAATEGFDAALRHFGTEPPATITAYNFTTALPLLPAKYRALDFDTATTITDGRWWVGFAPYAKAAVGNAMIAAVTAGIPRQLRREHREIADVRHELRQWLGAEPSREQIAKRLLELEPPTKRTADQSEELLKRIDDQLRWAVMRPEPLPDERADTVNVGDHDDRDDDDGEDDPDDGPEAPTADDSIDRIISDVAASEAAKKLPRGLREVAQWIEGAALFSWRSGRAWNDATELAKVLGVTPETVAIAIDLVPTLIPARERIAKLEGAASTATPSTVAIVRRKTAHVLRRYRRTLAAEVRRALSQTLQNVGAVHFAIWAESTFLRTPDPIVAARYRKSEGNVRITRMRVNRVFFERVITNILDSLFTGVQQRDLAERYRAGRYRLEPDETIKARVEIFRRRLVSLGMFERLAHYDSCETKFGKKTIGVEVLARRYGKGHPVASIANDLEGLVADITPNRLLAAEFVVMAPVAALVLPIEPRDEPSHAVSAGQLAAVRDSVAGRDGCALVRDERCRDAMQTLANMFWECSPYRKSKLAVEADWVLLQHVYVTRTMEQPSSTELEQLCSIAAKVFAV
jgi:transposase